MDNAQLAELQARLDSLESENHELKRANLELSGELELWKPSQRVEVATPPDRRKAADFVVPRANVRQLTLNEAAALSEGDLVRAIQNHMSEQLPSLANAPASLVYNLKVKYPIGLAAAIKGRHKDAKKQGYRDFGHCLSLEKFGFKPFVSDSELKAAIF